MLRILQLSSNIASVVFSLQSYPSHWVRGVMGNHFISLWCKNFFILLRNLTLLKVIEHVELCHHRLVNSGFQLANGTTHEMKYDQFCQAKSTISPDCAVLIPLNFNLPRELAITRCSSNFATFSYSVLCLLICTFLCLSENNFAIQEVHALVRLEPSTSSIM